MVLRKEDGPNTLVVSVYATNPELSSSSQSAYLNFLISLEHAISLMLSRERVDSLLVTLTGSVIQSWIRSQQHLKSIKYHLKH